MASRPEHPPDTGQLPLLVIALGGNALIRKGQTGTVAEQFENLRLPMRQIARLSQTHRIVITHGNGPQVGDLLLQQECCDSVPKLPLEILVAMTQGQLGYMIESTLDTELSDMGHAFAKRLVSLVSYVAVDRDDPAFADPTKPIGPTFTEEQAKTLPYPVRQTARGWRRVVASPRPVNIVERREIVRLVEDGFIVICCGGGGIPVIREGRSFQGVDAVIDKDLVSALLARRLNADAFIIATDVPGAALDFGTEQERYIGATTAEEMRAHLRQGHFPAGSMGPKVEACLDYLAQVDGRAVICSIEDIEAAALNTAGSRLTP